MTGTEGRYEGTILTLPAFKVGHFEDGYTLVVEGHGHSPEIIAELFDVELDGEGEANVEEVYLHWTPRVKWCSRHDGWGCDDEGEWHGHWFAVQRNPKAPDTFFTLITRKPVKP